jgi:hypothetical protein
VAAVPRGRCGTGPLQLETVSFGQFRTTKRRSRCLYPVFVLIAALALAGTVAAGTAAGPHLTGTSPAPRTVVLDWTGVQGPYVVLWQCFTVYGCFDTMQPNTGTWTTSTAPAGVDVYRVCDPSGQVNVVLEAGAGHRYGLAGRAGAKSRPLRVALSPFTRRKVVAARPSC